jgi:hypothetical protein
MTGQREGDLLTLTRSQLTDDGIIFSVGKCRSYRFVVGRGAPQSAAGEAPTIPANP